MNSLLTIVDAGVGTSVQDGGRPGWAHVGVSRSGAVDPVLAGQLNRLVGNDATAALLETAGGLTVRVDGPTTVAATPDVAVHQLAAGDTVTVGPLAGEVWGYLAMRGGVAVEPVLGSRSRDSRSGLGPPALTTGATVAVGPDPATMLAVDHGAPPRRSATIVLWPGPRAAWFSDDAWTVLTAAPWVVTADVSRVGMRLHGPALPRTVAGELPSEGLVLGAVQVPGDGQPVVMLTDHPTTGGYPVIAVVDPTDLPTVAQTRPGSTLRFRRR